MTLPETSLMETPQVNHLGLLDMQVCVPAEWTDGQAASFAESRYPCGTTAGWQMRRQGDAWLGGADERVACEVRRGFVHIMFDA